MLPHYTYPSSPSLTTHVHTRASLWCSRGLTLPSRHLLRPQAHPGAYLAHYGKRTLVVPQVAVATNTIVRLDLDYHIPPLRPPTSIARGLLS